MVVGNKIDLLVKDSEGNFDPPHTQNEEHSDNYGDDEKQKDGTGSDYGGGTWTNSPSTTSGNLEGSVTAVKKPSSAREDVKKWCMEVICECKDWL